MHNRAEMLTPERRVRAEMNGNTGPYRVVQDRTVAAPRVVLAPSPIAVDWIVVAVILGMVAYLGQWPVLVETVARWMVGFSPTG